MSAADWPADWQVRGALLGVPLHGLALNGAALNRTGLNGAELKEQALDGIVAWFEQAFQAQVSRRVYVVRAGTLLEAERSLRLKQLLQAGDLNLVGEQAVSQALRWSGGGREAFVSPEQWLSPVLAGLAARGGKVFYLGGAPGVAEAWAEQLRQGFQGLKVVTQDGYGEKWGPENDRVLRRIRGEAPELLLVGLGSPYQEEYVHAHASLTGVPVCVAVGRIAEAGRRGRRAELRAGKVGEQWARWGGEGVREHSAKLEAALLWAKVIKSRLTPTQ